jgi:glycosyltransferase involved in cell wall biosynthesis
VADRRRVVIVAAWFPPWGGGGAIRMAKLGRYLPELGWDVTVLASEEHAPDYPDDHLLADLPSAVRVVRVRGPLNALGRPIGRATTSWRQGRGNPITRGLKAAARAFFIPDRWIGWAWSVARVPFREVAGASVVLSSGPPHSGHLAGRWLARRLLVPHVVDLRDDWAGNPLHASPAPWYGPIDRLLEGVGLRNAAAIVVVTDEAARTLGVRRRHLRERIRVISNGFDPADLVYVSRRAAVAPADPVEVLYAGSIRTPVQVGVLPQAFGAAVDPGGPPPRLTVLGFADPGHRAAFERAIPPDRVAFHEPIGHRSALAAMADAGVLLVITGGGGGGNATMTGKLYESLGVRRPILLVGPPGPAADLVRGSRAGFVAEPEDERAIAEALSRALAAARDPAFPGAPPEVLATIDRRELASVWAALLDAVSRPPS